MLRCVMSADVHTVSGALSYRQLRYRPAAERLPEITESERVRKVFFKLFCVFHHFIIVCRQGRNFVFQSYHPRFFNSIRAETQLFTNISNSALYFLYVSSKFSPFVLFEKLPSCSFLNSSKLVI